MKKLVNRPDDVIDEMLDGMVAAHPDQLKRLPDSTVLIRKDAPVNGKVGLVSGGGSGHEPAHAGYIGDGLLDAAVAGEVFTSPTPDQIFEAIKAVNSGKGVLLVVKNYSGDVMNFDMAADMAEAEGIDVEQVIVNDDIAVEKEEDRRGIAGTIFVHKIAGAAAAAGKNLEEVKDIAEHVIHNVRSMGVSLSPSIVPASGKPGFTLGDNEIEIGTGIHGEQGMERKEIMPADELTTELLTKVLDKVALSTGDNIAVMINGLGATPLMELYIVNRKVSELLKQKQVNVVKTFVGEYMTSLEMAGCSISILKLDGPLYDLLK
ncbi:dihydroxyacetone kinase subunit DhaK [Tuberibacillus sp. Marseille-P3662]|uniref:dihydroxyacetone kinase subunit DhaK n=1 Tax=Tuberibacillus sp. Marseille-P3662 TaxID=1965358 RepID=UPI000A1CA64C|nr:dihydroxyacetone kinase subunit DhaK [Tuberibacillus sp. Marseille-P3662]